VKSASETAIGRLAVRLLQRRRVSTPGRLANVDYSRDGWYFVTFCTHRRRRIMWGTARAIAERELRRLCVRFPGLSIDSSNILLDHVHVIFRLHACDATVSAIVQSYKSITAREIRAAVTIDRVWQRGFHDRIVRNETELIVLREYVEMNASHHRR
jgi:REP element-mobilizing transposase RayT